MGRPAKSVNTMNNNLSKSKKQNRLDIENKIKGSSDKIIPPSYLTAHQKKLFKCIVSELEKSGILGNLDIYILSTCSIAIDRLQTIETMINKDINLLYDKDIMSSKDKYTKDLYRCCNELSLSPQSRAKMANINVQTKEENPLFKALLNDEE